MKLIKAEDIVFDNGVKLESYIRGMIKNIDESRIPPISHVSIRPTFESFTSTPQQFNFAVVNPSLAKSAAMTVEDNIIKLFNAHYTYATINVDGFIQFNTVNGTGEVQEMYLEIMPRYYAADDEYFEEPVNWTSRAIHAQYLIQPGTRRASLPFSQYFTFGRETVGLDFTIKAQRDQENLSYTFTRNSVMNIEGLSAQYE